MRFEVEVSEDTNQKLKLVAVKTGRSRKALAQYILEQQAEQMVKALNNK